MIYLAGVYLVVAVVVGWVLRWTDRQPCPCCDGEPANHGWWYVLLCATAWPASALSLLWFIVAGEARRP